MQLHLRFPVAEWVKRVITLLTDLVVAIRILVGSHSVPVAVLRASHNYGLRRGEVLVVLAFSWIVIRVQRHDFDRLSPAISGPNLT